MCLFGQVSFYLSDFWFGRHFLVKLTTLCMLFCSVLSMGYSYRYLFQGLMQHHAEIAEYFRTRGVSVIFLFRRNLLRRMISVLANLYDRNAKLLNGTHKSHVHSPHEVSVSLSHTQIDT